MICAVLFGGSSSSLGSMTTHVLQIRRECLGQRAAVGEDADGGISWLPLPLLWFWAARARPSPACLVRRNMQLCVLTIVIGGETITRPNNFAANDEGAALTVGQEIPPTHIRHFTNRRKPLR